ncbi:MAG TPA: hypothetical protein VM914_05060 [Pyrinomonadaceae bacterium]|jgi:hypothetical protein|nr:hypothetical protein [Pyrinomonadaceae bacterium]
MSSDQRDANGGTGAPASHTGGEGLQTAAEVKPTLRARTRKWLAERHEIIKDYAQVVAILIAALWAIYVFFYENVYKPSQESPDVITSAILEEGGRAKGLIAVKATATARNVGKRRANIMGAWFNVEGVRVNARADDGALVGRYRANVEGQARNKSPDGAEIDMHASRYSDYDEANAGGRSFIFSTNFLLNRSALEPNEEESKVVTFFVPEKDFDLVRVILHVVYVVDGRLFRRDWLVDDAGQLRLVRQIKSCDECKWEDFQPYKNDTHFAQGRKCGMAHTQSVVDLPLWEKVKGEPPNLHSTPNLPPPPGGDADAGRP